MLNLGCTSQDDRTRHHGKRRSRTEKDAGPLHGADAGDRARRAKRRHPRRGLRINRRSAHLLWQKKQPRQEPGFSTDGLPGKNTFNSNFGS